MGNTHIDYHKEMDIDRLCFERASDRFLQTGKKEDAFDVYFCYLEMFIGDYEKTSRMIELLSEFEENGSRLLLKHRDHYSHSVYVFLLGIAVFESVDMFREAYASFYNLKDEHEQAHHFLKYWGLTALFHDIGYPFELPFEQVCSYFEVSKKERETVPYIAYHDMEIITTIGEELREKVKSACGIYAENTNQLFAELLSQKLGGTYGKTTEDFIKILKSKPENPNENGYYMDHAYFSALILFKKLFEEVRCPLGKQP